MAEEDTYLPMDNFEKFSSNPGNRGRRMSDITWAINKFETAQPNRGVNKHPAKVLTKSTSQADLHWNKSQFHVGRFTPAAFGKFPTDCRNSVKVLHALVD